MTNFQFMGVDPGPSCGIALLRYNETKRCPWEWMVLQVDGQSANVLLDSLMSQFFPSVVAVEKFIPSNRAGTTGKDAELTRDIVSFVTNLPAHILVRARKAGDVKPWASDKRLEVTRFPMGPKFRDARDAGRHALYAAIRDGGLRDPLA